MKPKKDNVRIYDKFEYHTEDISCASCLHYEKSEVKKRGCPFTVCPYADFKAEAIANGRIKRARGFFKWDM